MCELVQVRALRRFTNLVKVAGGHLVHLLTPQPQLSIHIYKYVYMYTNTFVCLHVCVCVYVYIYICIYPYFWSFALVRVASCVIMSVAITILEAPKDS